MNLREFVPEDAKKLHALHIDTIRRVNSQDYAPDQIESWASSQSVQGVRNSAQKIDDRFVVEQGDEILGFGDRKNDTITGLYVSSRAQGQGVGSLLLNRLLSCIRNDGFVAARVKSSLTAASFYEKHGFVRAKHFVNEGENVRLECVLLQKLL